MSFENPRRTTAPPERFDLVSQRPADITTAIMASLTSDARFAAAVEMMGQDENFSAAFQAELSKRVEALAQDKMSPFGPQLGLEEALQVARLVAEEFGVDMRFFENDFETVPKTIPDGIAPLDSADESALARQALAGLRARADASSGEDSTVGLPPKSERPDALARQALASLRSELVAERRAPELERESHAEALRSRAESLSKTGWRSRSGRLPTLERQRHQRTVDSVGKLIKIWANPGNRDEIVAEADRLLSGWLSKENPEPSDERTLKNRIFTALLLTAEKKWDAMKLKSPRSPKDIRGAVI
jgi:hypothetical protein